MNECIIKFMNVSIKKIMYVCRCKIFSILRCWEWMLGSFDRFNLMLRMNSCNPMLRINVGNVRNECGEMLGMLESFDRCILKIEKLGMLRMNVRNFW